MRNFKEERGDFTIAIVIFALVLVTAATVAYAWPKSTSTRFTAPYAAGQALEAGIVSVSQKANEITRDSMDYEDETVVDRIDEAQLQMCNRYGESDLDKREICEAEDGECGTARTPGGSATPAEREAIQDANQAAARCLNLSMLRISIERFLADYRMHGVRIEVPDRPKCLRTGDVDTDLYVTIRWSFYNPNSLIGNYVGSTATARKSVPRDSAFHFCAPRS